jgi:hypothetical protein
MFQEWPKMLMNQQGGIFILNAFSKVHGTNGTNRTNHRLHPHSEKDLGLGAWPKFALLKLAIW